jgi:hypothetical protein
MKQQKDYLSLKDLIVKTRSFLAFIKRKWLIILVWGILGGLAGLFYAFIKKPSYVATCSFVLEENKTSGLSQYAGLASMAGINIGNDGSGIFEGDNIIALYTSRTMIAKALLSPVIVNGKKQLLINRYINYLDLRKTWANDNNIPSIDFNTSLDSLNRTQDSLVTSITTAINKKVLTVDKPDKKLSIVNVDVTFGDEIFAKAFNDRLVATVNDFYIKTKTKKSAQNLQVLQKQADSVRTVLNNSISGVASALDAAPNANPLLSVLRVPSQKKQVDVQASSAIYSEIVKNLELAKISLRQETPLIQVIDNPIFPLTVNKPGKIKYFISGFFLLALLSALYVTLKKIFEHVMSDAD